MQALAKRLGIRPTHANRADLAELAALERRAEELDRQEGVARGQEEVARGQKPRGQLWDQSAKPAEKRPPKRRRR